MLTQKLHSEALARKRKEEKKRKERKGVCERSCSWARAASGAVVHSSSSSSWQKQRVSFCLMKLVDNFTIQTSEVAVQHLPHLVQLCQRQVVGEQLYRECVKGFIILQSWSSKIRIRWEKQKVGFNLCVGGTFSIGESFDRQVIGFFCCKVKAAAYCVIVSEINEIGEKRGASAKLEIQHHLSLAICCIRPKAPGRVK